MDNLKPFRLCFDVYAGNSINSEGFYYISETRNYNIYDNTETIDLSKWEPNSIKSCYLHGKGIGKLLVATHFNTETKKMKILWSSISNFPHYAKNIKLYIEFNSLSLQRDLLLNEILK